MLFVAQSWDLFSVFLFIAPINGAIVNHAYEIQVLSLEQFSTHEQLEQIKNHWKVIDKPEFSATQKVIGYQLMGSMQHGRYLTFI